MRHLAVRFALAAAFFASYSLSAADRPPRTNPALTREAAPFPQQADEPPV